DLDEAMRLHLAWAAVPGVVELVPGARTVLVRFDPARIAAGELAAVLSTTVPDAGELPSTGEATVPVRYDGEDLAEVAGLLGVSAEEIVERHLAAEWRVAFSGFAPGFGYLVGSDPLFDVPRRATPRTRVPAGSVGLAGAFTGVYPRESPGGWQLIGHTDALMWDLERDPPALLTPGTRVRFERARPAVAGLLSPAARSGGALAPAAPRGGAFRVDDATRASAGRRGDTPAGSRERPAPLGVLEVIHPALQLLVQDRGRPGQAALGVPVSGAADRTALRDANRAVGNRRDAAVLECVGAVTLRYRGTPTVAAVCGALGELTLLRHRGPVEPPELAAGFGGSEDASAVYAAGGMRRDLPPGVPVALDDGDELELSPPVRGLRYVIAVRGGILAPQALGSASSDTLAGLGPAPLRAGDAVAVGDPRTAPYAVDPDPLPRDLPASGETVELEVVFGPRDDWFTDAAQEALSAQEWEVTPRSDRIGIRLHGSVPLERAVVGELPSEGAVTGAIQVPADGQPVLFLADHPLTGGYPIIAVVRGSDLDRAAQLPAGARVRFRPASP
ncbi:MAG: urea amidolyase family protein, partial [Microbacterium sp.]